MKEETVEVGMKIEKPEWERLESVTGFPRGVLVQYAESLPSDFTRASFNVRIALVSAVKADVLSETKHVPPGKVSISELADMCNVNSGSVSAIVEKWEDSKYAPEDWSLRQDFVPLSKSTIETIEMVLKTNKQVYPENERTNNLMETLRKRRNDIPWTEGVEDSYNE